MEMPVGALKVALSSGPSMLEAVPLPAKSPTSPPGVMVRTRLLPPSAMKMVPPAACTPHRSALLNLAFEPTPLAYPATPLCPASVDTMPSTDTGRTRNWRKSFTARPRPSITVMAEGLLKVAMVPRPSCAPEAPEPASVDTA